MAAYDGRGSGSGGDFLNTGLHTTDYMDGRGVDPGDFGFGKHPMLVLGLLVAADITFAVIASPFTLASKLKSVAKSRKSRRKMNKKAEIFKLNHNQGLCDRCREITIAKLRQGIEHSPDYSSLLENSHKCPLCRLIASSLPPPPQVASNTKISVTLYDMDRVEIGIRGASPLRIWSLPGMYSSPTLYIAVHFLKFADLMQIVRRFQLLLQGFFAQAIVSPLTLILRSHGCNDVSKLISAVSPIPVLSTQYLINSHTVLSMFQCHILPALSNLSRRQTRPGLLSVTAGALYHFSEP